MMQKHYQHLNLNAEPFRAANTETLPSGKAVCVGRNYLDHIQELGNEPSDLPVLFIKPYTAMVHVEDEIFIPSNQGECHNELELAFLIGKQLSGAGEQACANAIVGVGLALDLTLRNVQSQLKQAGQPWERAKAFDGSCPLSAFVPLDGYAGERYTFSLDVNGVRKQNGDTDFMLHKLLPLLSEISQHFTLLPGDVVLTGTPKGVGPLAQGDKLLLRLDEHFSVSCKVSEHP